MVEEGVVEESVARATESLARLAVHLENQRGPVEY